MEKKQLAPLCRALPVLLATLVTLAMLVTLAGCGSGTSAGGGLTIADETAFSYSESLDENGHWVGIRALDYVDAFSYLGLTIPSEVHQITEDDVKSEIDMNILTYYEISEQVTDRAVADGDTINIDYVGTVGGAAFEGGDSNEEGKQVVVGDTELFAEDFLEQLIGAMPGDKVNVKVTLPDSYVDESVQSKEAVFATTVHYIVDYDVELTDEYVEENMLDSYGWSTIAEMEEDVRATLEANAIQSYITNYFTTEAPVKSVPARLINYQERYMVQYFEEYAAYYGFESIEPFIAEYESVSSIEELADKYYDNNLSSATYCLVVQAVAEDAGITVSDEDLEHYLGSDYASYEEDYGMPFMMQSALSSKVMEYVKGSAVLA